MRNELSVGAGRLGFYTQSRLEEPVVSSSSKENEEKLMIFGA
jgi:hypothetical protein